MATEIYQQEEDKSLIANSMDEVENVSFRECMVSFHTKSIYNVLSEISSLGENISITPNTVCVVISGIIIRFLLIPSRFIALICSGGRSVSRSRLKLSMSVCLSV